MLSFSIPVPQLFHQDGLCKYLTLMVFSIKSFFKLQD